MFGQTIRLFAEFTGIIGQLSVAINSGWQTHLIHNMEYVISGEV